MTAPVDRRLLQAGLGVTTPQLVDLWAAHCPAHLPVPTTCPGCGHSYLTDGPLCPTARIVRPLLRRRRFETHHDDLIKALTDNQHADLTGRHLSTEPPPATPRRTRRPVGRLPATRDSEPGLFPITASLRRTPTGGTS